MGAAIQLPERSSWLRRRHPAARELVEGLEHLRAEREPGGAVRLTPAIQTAGTYWHLLYVAHPSAWHPCVLCGGRRPSR